MVCYLAAQVSGFKAEKCIVAMVTGYEKIWNRYIEFRRQCNNSANPVYSVAIDVSAKEESIPLSSRLP